MRPGQAGVPDLLAGLEVETVEVTAWIQHEDAAPVDQRSRDRPILRSPAPGIAVAQPEAPKLLSAVRVKGAGEVRSRIREEIDRHTIHNGHAGIARSNPVLPGHGQGNGSPLCESPASFDRGIVVRSPKPRPVTGPKPRLPKRPK